MRKCSWCSNEEAREGISLCIECEKIRENYWKGIMSVRQMYKECKLLKKEYHRWLTVIYANERRWGYHTNKGVKSRASVLPNK